MDIIFLLLPISLFLALCGAAAYFWCVRSGQFDDLDSPSMRILFDEEITTDSQEVKEEIETD